MVFDFADDVSEFYGYCSPKEPFEAEDAKGSRKFAAEWGRRRGCELSVTIADSFRHSDLGIRPSFDI
ncbi:MAG: hypothetical protein MUF06_08650 [Pirellulaceae bacterium]|nr:hypothetical protein [Pirellulaceae bacterium]